MNYTETEESALEVTPTPDSLYTDLLHVRRSLARRIDRMDDDLNTSLDAAMELIQTIRLSTDEPMPGTGECFAQVFFSLHAKLTALDILRQGISSLTKLIEYRES
ncbi:hypothetical protein [Streptomyces sp. NPDC092307]|uniref:hypothetical protein n=1 Tax=Streptomyces sp. NPDC092307 TaxID=3366013 RepID=UPI00381E682A